MHCNLLFSYGTVGPILSHTVISKERYLSGEQYLLLIPLRAHTCLAHTYTGTHIYTDIQVRNTHTVIRKCTVHTYSYIHMCAVWGEIITPFSYTFSLEVRITAANTISPIWPQALTCQHTCDYWREDEQNVKKAHCCKVPSNILVSDSEIPSVKIQHRASWPHIALSHAQHWPVWAVVNVLRENPKVKFVHINQTVGAASKMSFLRWREYR